MTFSARLHSHSSTRTEELRGAAAAAVVLMVVTKAMASKVAEAAMAAILGSVLLVAGLVVLAVATQSR